MYAERIILETDSAGHLKEAPRLPPNRAIEAIFLVLDETERDAIRRPHPDIAGKVRVMGNIQDSVAESDWNLPR